MPPDDQRREGSWAEWEEIRQRLAVQRELDEQVQLADVHSWRRYPLVPSEDFVVTFQLWRSDEPSVRQMGPHLVEGDKVFSCKTFLEDCDFLALPAIVGEPTGAHDFKLAVRYESGPLSHTVVVFEEGDIADALWSLANAMTVDGYSAFEYIDSSEITLASGDER